MNKTYSLIAGLLAIAITIALAEATPTWAVQQDRNHMPVPACFVEDTVYYMVLDLQGREFSLWYGPWELFSCGFTVAGDTTSPAEFAERWLSPDRAPWQEVKQRGVWSGRPAVSDTVINVVSEVSKVDPELIKRVYPDRFLLELTGGFRLRVLTPDGASQKRRFAETWDSFTTRIKSFGRLRELTLVVTPNDAQSLYYALEPGTPVVLGAGKTEQ
jgi:hypothetical protein